ncbi:MAG: 3-hydroxyacyl-CoA dehydrogenase NAD-binding domain-containing protein, partial [Planctomycetota bacterium]|nr:3-hydroxyacyl-CoA dehydrogenase NAD-binding domain-containing protein [Planctomycetota bacterium]
MGSAPFESVAVVGAGTMGNGIAQVFAQHGVDVLLLDLDALALERGTAAVERSLARMVKKERM